MDILHMELGGIYTAMLEHRQPSLGPCQIQYSDFAHWQQRQLKTGELDTQISYWKQQLQQAPARLELPTDMPRPAQFRGKGASVPYQLSAAETTALQGFARDSKASLVETLLAATQVQLWLLLVCVNTLTAVYKYCACIRFRRKWTCWMDK